MSNDERYDLLYRLGQGAWRQQNPVMVVGAAVLDMVVKANALPVRGGDLAVQLQGYHLGGCALNIAVALKRLGIASHNLLPLGQGPWAERLRVEMAQRGVHSALEVGGQDNGWCMALVEPDGERTFISIDGVENQWRLAWLPATVEGLLYLSGYQLSGKQGAVLVDWMLGLPPQVRIVLDLGPRIDVMEPALLQRLIRPGVILTINQREAQHLGLQHDLAAFSRQQWQITRQPVIVRCGSEGCYYYAQDDDHGWVAACKVKVADSIGAGDSHCAGVLAGLALGLTTRQAILLANSVAGYVVAQPGGSNAPTLAQMLASEGISLR
ncbi:sugar/nucleoside kinase (ribokinase family) [Gibbsiella quercinecans]|uniref:Kinase n=1 Tax=Gibbsiella quercinecans TaxID=929813 RepID=A0A250AVP9_9GAMM|nr:PfkB family carbohydrate kinase [Gibbsiella quercinecans]ATA18017.1 kinase [Gibbsiella quercinecans]RLM03456.1 kinase [Gibbsiella quercinecans]RLM09519.1 kinase [Gibbsiella quercinecans]TCT92335.1 sugar/nucleoside kinase (ribokinase family) [Gibbsiella quercinecans]